MKKLIVLCLILFGSAAAVTVFAADSAFDELSQAVKKKTVEKMADQQPATTDSGQAKDDCSAKTEHSPGCKAVKTKKP